MLYREFGRTGWEISAIGLGTWNIGNQWGEMEDSTAHDIVKTAFDHGMNLFDAAESYGIPNGLSEIRLGQALKGIRDQVHIVSKVGNWGKRTGQGVPKTTVDMIRVCGHACLGRLRTDWIDVLLCHEGDIQDPSVYIAGFEALREEGFIREYGISTNDLQVLKNFHSTSDGKCAVVEVDYSLINRSAEEGFLPFCQENQIGILIRGPVAMGILADKYDADTVFMDAVRHKWNQGESARAEYEEKLARLDRVKTIANPDRDLVTTGLRYVISHSAEPVAIPGATSVNQVRINAEAGVSLLLDDELNRLKVL
ncbi:TPA: aldo/keto reductase [Candidatus Poribacteria bacterium]|nr:aldo/keto reductase [Candidatus Poribacteria bacterium]HIA68826.1 aldo/keto reductase [Candidatus Poribacteria bacterium]HIB91701.1 aldo/keto reductase [Candidatus Poribacteria bacterium]HIC01507.1 aldo/keto reductase [Candidatus Poribacteria bacterium]HIC17811.1 aldo/keto reductase [Candidatus Poribacteria bacterium]